MEARLNTAVIIPALNEERSLPLVLEALHEQRVDEIIVVDNGSRDGTAEVGRRAGAKVIVEPRRGYGQACLAGMDHCRDADIVVFLDADYSDYPEDLPSILEPILNLRCDMVIGSRLLTAGGRSALLPQAYWGNQFACFLMRMFFGARYSDLGPFRAIRRESLDRLDMRDRNFGWTVEMQVKAKQAGLRVAEVPVRYRKRIGTSKITGTVSGTIKAGWKILYMIGKLRCRRPRFDSKSRAMHAASKE